MNTLFDPLTLKRGPTLKNRFLLAPLTNLQSHADGVLSDEEFRWLTMRSEGGFAMTMTCAAHVQANGQGFPGQLGVFGEQHVEGLTRLAETIKGKGSAAICQLHHAGMRAPGELIEGQPVCPSADEKSGARALTEPEIEGLVEAFAAAALRCERAGFDGVEIHGAHGYLLCQFLSPRYNRREDEYGGSAENRARLCHEVVAGIRAACRPDFCLGVRLSPERFGLQMQHMLELAQSLMHEGRIDFLDLSLWDAFKLPEEVEYKSQRLLDWFLALERYGVRVGVAGKIRTPADADRVLEAGADAVFLGRAAIIHHDYPDRLVADPAFAPLDLPVSAEHLRAEGVSEAFLTYLREWEGFVS